MLNMKYMRICRRLSQKAVADAIGVSQNQISLYEAGKRKPGYNELCKLEDFYGVSHRELFKDLKDLTIDDITLKDMIISTKR